MPVLIEFTFCDLLKRSLLKKHLDFALLQLFSFKVSEFLNSLCESRNTSSQGKVCNQTPQSDHNHTRKVLPQTFLRNYSASVSPFQHETNMK